MKIFLQARLGSTRLKRKVLLSLGGKSVVEDIVERLKPLGLGIVLVTGPVAHNRQLIREAKRIGIAYFAGSEENVLHRFYSASKKFKTSAIVRVTGDCPLIDPELIASGIKAFKRGKWDLVTNARIRSFPDGLDYEIFNAGALKKAWKAKRLHYKSEKAFDTAFFNPTKEIAALPDARVKDVILKPGLETLRWTLDYPADLRVIKGVYRGFGGKPPLKWREVLRFMRKNPKLSRINERHIKMDY